MKFRSKKTKQTPIIFVIFTTFKHNFFYSELGYAYAVPLLKRMLYLQSATNNEQSVS